MKLLKTVLLKNELPCINMNQNQCVQLMESRKKYFLNQNFLNLFIITFAILFL